MTSIKPPLWINWQTHRRTDELCRHFNIRQIRFLYKGNRLARYVKCIYQTLRCLRQEKPKVLLVQNPSIVLSVLVALWRKFNRSFLIIDAHNEAVEPYNYANAFVRGISRWLLKNADLTIVTNPYLTSIVAEAGGRALVLPDKLPLAPAHIFAQAAASAPTPVLALIATYAKDEPIATIIEAVAQLKQTARLKLTGNPKRFLATYDKPIPDNVEFTGFLADDDYWSLLRNAAAIIDLTTKDNCLVCGAYEGVAAETPLILSDNPATKDYFSNGVVHTGADSAAVKAAIETALEQQQTLRAEIKNLKSDLERRWLTMAEPLAKLLKERCGV